ncbi:mitogen-activated protein kinase-binding protein 1-like [Stegastes partitus]|uniref:Mitogen-activated protein kinase-binding protein 1-like n=1 Tax=Stegastes partitus TaxID=144197 RepID=A0A9Y4KBK8_9TELE|nr:PREDICTED: mitogen-activated protein kinase-binding protein 1-like [Stegastes partitus]
MSKVSLEKVLGITTTSGSALTSDPNSGLVAYPAGCVIVLLHPETNRQTHIVNTSRKPFSAVAFSHDGRHLVTGESGHLPCVRVWEVDGGQVAEVQSHKYGVSCVSFSTNSCYIVSVGFQHDMTVSVWDWRKASIIASNKVSSRVFAVSFCQDNSYFVTAGNQHVKFWYLDASKERRVNSTVPLIGRSGLLGDHKNSVFSGVACGRGLMASNTYCITSSGLLCLLNSSRKLEAWVDLKTAAASCLSITESFVFCGCADGVIRVFNPSNLQYISTLQRPHRLGVDLTPITPHGGPLPASPGAQFPDTLALTFNSASCHLTCVYSDHSLYVWDVRDLKNAAKLYSALYHSSSVWSVEVYPELQDPSEACLPPSSFLTCSSDNTIRLWNAAAAAAAAGRTHLHSNDLLRIVYVGEAAGAAGKTGVRLLAISPDGQLLAAGDRCGNLRIFALDFLDELVKIEAHDSEVLCLEFSPESTGVKLLASASRDRLIHVFDLEKNYSLEQTLNDHSASVSAVKFTGESPEVRLVSCGADKSIYFQTAEQTSEGLRFSRSHHVVEKTTPNDMDLDSSRTHVAVACQDRNVRVYNVETGKLKKCLEGSSSDEGALLKVHMDPSGSFLATSCSDKNISVFDYESGERVASLFGHSETITCMRFSQDCRHLITVSADSCVFVWRLDSQLSSIMRKRRGLRTTTAPAARRLKQQSVRRETFIAAHSPRPPRPDGDEEAELRAKDRPDAASDATQLQSNRKLTMVFRKLGLGQASSSVQSDVEPSLVQHGWAEPPDPLTICSSFSPTPTKSQEDEDEDFHPQALDSLLGDEEDEDGEEEEEEEADLSTPDRPASDAEPRRGRRQWSALKPPTFPSAIRTQEDENFHPQALDSLLEDEDGEVISQVLQTKGEDQSSFILYNTTPDREFDVEGTTDQGAEPELSQDSALSDDSTGSVEQHDVDRISFLTFTDSPPPVSMATSISEESNLSNITVNSESSGGTASADETRRGHGDGSEVGGESSGSCRNEGVSVCCVAAGEAEDSVSVQRCRQAADELRLAASRAVHLYLQLRDVQQHSASASILQDAFQAVCSELQEAQQQAEEASGAP